jgi:hypothetical protein
MKLPTLSLLVAIVCADIAHCQPIISANVELSNGSSEQRSEFGHKLPDAITIDIVDFIESQNNANNKNDFNIIDAKVSLSDLFLDLDDEFVDEAAQASQKFAQNLPELLAYRLAESIPLGIRLSRIKPQGNVKDDDKQVALIGVFGDNSKHRSLINQIVSPDLTNQLIDIIIPLSRNATKVLIENLNLVVGSVSDIITNRKFTQQWMPRLKEATHQVLTRNFNFIINHIQEKLEEKIPDFVIDKVGDTLGVGTMTKAIIRSLLGDIIKRRCQRN